MLFACRADISCWGRKSLFKTAIWSVIHVSRTGLYCQKCWCASILMRLAEIQKAAVHRVIGSGDEFSLAGAKEQGQCRHFAWLPHASDRLGLVKLFQHFLFMPGIILSHKGFHKRSAHAGGRDAVATDVVT